MAGVSIEQGARRLTQLAWACALAALALVVLRLAQGCRPDQPADIHAFIADIFDAFSKEVLRFVIVPGAFLLFIVILLKGSLALAGRPWCCRTEASRRLAVNSIEAEDLTQSDLAKLLALGYRVGPREPLPGGGWRVAANRRWGWADPRRARQSVEFRFSGSELTVLHQMGHLYLFESGEREYQRWFVEALARGTSLDRPPRRLCGVAIIIFSATLLLAGAGAALHLLAEESREAWALGVYVTLLAFSLMIAPAGLMSFLSRRWNAARGLYVPAAALLAAGWFFFLSRPDEWQTAPWRTTDDPAILCRAGISAWQDSHWPVEQRISSRDEAALAADRAIRKRLAEMGARGAEAVLTHDEKNERWCALALRKSGAEAVPVLVAQLARPEAKSKRRALALLAFLPKTPAAARAAAGCVKDPDSGVRHAALEYLSSYPLGSADRELADFVGNELETAPSLWDSINCGTAAQALVRWRGPDAVPFLIDQLGQPPSDNIGVVNALSELGDPRAVPVFGDLIRRSALWWFEDAVETFGEPLIGACLDVLEKEDDYRIHCALRKKLPAEIDLDAATLRRTLALAGHANAEIRITALHVLARSTQPEAIARATAALKGPEGWAVLRSLRARGLASVEDMACHLDLPAVLKEIGPAEKTLAEQLVAIVEDSRRTNKTREAAFQALERADRDRASALARRLANDAWARSRLSGLVDLLPASMVIDLLGDPVVELRVRAARALGRLKSPESVSALCELIRRERFGLEEQEEKKSMRSAVIAALGEIGDSRGRELLLEVLRNAETKALDATACDAASALAGMGRADGLPALRRALLQGVRGVYCGRPLIRFLWEPREEPDDRTAIRGLGHMGEEGAEILIEAIEDFRFSPRWATALGMTKSSRAYDVLAPLLSDSSEYLRRGAVLGLAELGDRRAIPLLLPLVNERSPWVAVAGAWAIQCVSGSDLGCKEPTHSLEGLDPREVSRLRAAVREWAARNTSFIR